ncbi:MAG: hypothetical protein WA784_13745, partial [Albidovulum sp.]
MKNLLSTYDRLANGLSRLGLDATPLLARFTFAAVLLVYFWNSALTKIGDGIFGFLRPTDGAYIQIFPKAFEAAGYDSSQFGVF